MGTGSTSPSAPTGRSAAPERQPRRLALFRARASDYDANLAALAAKGLLRGTSWFVALACLVLAAGTTTLMFLDGGVESAPGRWITGAVAAGAAVAGVLWWRGGWPRERRSLVFVAAVDVGLTAVLVTCANPMIALPGCLWFFLVSEYLLFTHGRSALRLHCLWVKANLLLFAVLGLVRGAADVTAVIFFVVALTATLVLTPLFGQMFADAMALDSRRSAELARRDPLTRVLNRRGLELAAPALLDRVAAEQGTVAVLLLDVDRFKSVNDVHGHLRGDEVLTLLGERLAASVRSHGLVARTGGEEFVVLDSVHPDGIVPMAERLRALCHNSADPIPISVSVGAVGASAAELTGADPLSGLLIRADRAMYLAKQQGGNRVCTDLPAPGSRRPSIPTPRSGHRLPESVVCEPSATGRHVEP